MIKKLILQLTLIFLTFSCFRDQQTEANTIKKSARHSSTSPYLIILGTVQDGGSPHIACKKNCCKTLFNAPDISRQVISLGLIDPARRKKYLFEASPDFSYQCKNLLQHSFPGDEKEVPDAIFLTHAHIGHYSGLMYLGKESMNAKEEMVYAMPRMRTFLEENGPWSQLVKLSNIIIHPLKQDEALVLNTQLKVTPIQVPHRDEYSETVGFLIEGPNKKVLFIPDIDKWEKWERNILSILKSVDYAIVDGTFYDGEEINTRDIKEIPHPFIVESMGLFKNLPGAEKRKIYFIHFNHTNPLLNKESREYKTVIQNGFGIARMNLVIEL